MLQHLRAWVAYSRKTLDLYYWRTRAGAEIDFILYGEDGFYALEVKNTPRVRPEDLRALKSFKSDYPQATLILLYRGDERLLREGILCVPVKEFLTRLHPSRDIDA